MFVLDSNLRGAIAEQAVTLAAVRLGIPVYRPVHDHDRLDLVIRVGGRLWGIQCKSGNLSSDGSIVVARLGTNRCTPNGYVTGTYDSEEVDFFAIYCSDLDSCYLLPVSRFEGATYVHLRLSPARNGQQACTNLAEDFDFVGAIAQLGERSAGSRKVAGSNPASSTRSAPATVGSNPFRDRLGYWMERVAAGHEVVVTFRGKPRVLLKPVALPP